MLLLFSEKCFLQFQKIGNSLAINIMEDKVFNDLSADQCLLLKCCKGIRVANTDEK